MLIYAINHYALYLLILLRVVAFIAASPLMSLQTVPTWTKLGLGGFTALLMVPSVTGQVPDPFTDSANIL